MLVSELDTPSLLIDRDIMMKNLTDMQEYANRSGVKLRPHTKTHKMSRLAGLQTEIGAAGIAVAKVGEAEVMAAAGQRDIFIANEIVGAEKFRRIQELEKSAEISFGLDSVAQAKLVEEAFSDAEKPARVLIEIEVGENRSGVIEKDDFLELLAYLKICTHIRLAGIFSHDGNSYGAASREEAKNIHLDSQARTLEFAALARAEGFPIGTVSIGSTPSLLHGYPILPGITEIRPGTYIFTDAAQANHLGSSERNAATVLATVISKPTPERVILDVGAKGLTMQTRTKGLCTTKGLGVLKGWEDVTVSSVYDEHAILYNRYFHDHVEVGDKVEIIPNHICPAVNLHESAYLVSNGEVLEEIPVDCRGKLK